jgi:diguanylate cyclase (GGDEF)-like protein
LVDDDQSLLDSFRQRLRRNFEIATAPTARQALTILESEAPFAVIVANMTMPGMDGASLLGEVKRFFPSTVRLMLTGNEAQETASRAVNECEVYRFLTKPCPADGLERALDDATKEHLRWVQVGRSGAAPIDTARGTSRAFLRSRRIDVTTGLSNRRAFEVNVLTAFARQDSSSSGHVLVHLDIDNFRLINESCGFAAGDELLRHFSDVLLESVGPDVGAARLSADEFGVLLHDASASDALALSRRVLDALADRPFRWDGELLPVSASAGVVELTPSVQGVTAWLLAAETACGVARDLGGSRVHVPGPNDPEPARRQNDRQWLAKIRQAIDGDRFKLMFQRIVPLQPNADAGVHFELLIRMLDELGALVAPSVFMPIAERYHLAPAVDRWVIRNAFQWLSANADRQRQISLCSINLSAGSLCDPDFVTFLLATQQAFNTSANLVCLEVTETAAMANLGTAAGVIDDLRSLGFHFALDDFGSGLCSFTYLKNLPVDYLKIDGSFVKHMDTDLINCAMVRSINQIGQVTGKKTIAEFVENDAIRRALTDIGVDFGQGYVFHRPTPIESF